MPLQNCKEPGSWLTDKNGSLFFIDEGRGQTQMVLCAVQCNGEVETLVQCSSGPFPVTDLSGVQSCQDTLYISQYSYTDEDNTKTDFNIIYVTAKEGLVDVKGLCRAKNPVGRDWLYIPKQEFFCNKGTGYVSF